MNLKTWRKSLNKVEQEMALKHFKLSEFDSPDLQRKWKKYVP